MNDLEKAFKRSETRNIIEEIRVSKLTTDNLREIKHYIETEINIRKAKGE